MGLLGKKQAYPGSRESAYRCDPLILTIIGLDTDHKRGEHELWDERVTIPLDEAKVANVIKHGIKLPILIRKYGTGEDAVFAVADGRQRLRWVRRANEILAEKGEPLLTVPYLPVKGQRLTETDLALLGVATNIHVPDPPMIRARKAADLLDRGVAKETVAITFGVTTRTIDNWLHLLDATPAVQAAVASGDVTQTEARDLARLPETEQNASLERVRSPKANASNGSGRPVRKRGPNIRGKVRAVLDHDRETRELNRNYRKLLQWFAGEIDDEDVRKLLPGLPEAD